MVYKTTDRKAQTDNRRLAQWRVKWLIEHSTSHQLLWCIDSFVHPLCVVFRRETANAR
jgi:hypothetical protein